MSNRIVTAATATALLALSACVLIRDVLAGDLHTNVLQLALFLATATACVIWYGASRTEHVTDRVLNAEYEIRTDVALAAISHRHSTAK